MTQTFASTDKLEQLQTLTREYAKFSRSAAGIGNVIGGALGLIAYFVGAFAPLETWTRVLLASFPILWIIAKEILRSRYYQRHGRVLEPISRNERRWHIFLTGFVGLISLSVTALIGYGLLPSDPMMLNTNDSSTWGSMYTSTHNRPTLTLIGYLVFVWALPVLVWFYLHTTEEFIVGVFLIAQAAIVISGGHYAFGQQIQAPVMALVMLAVGMVQHRRYRQLETQLEALK